MKSLFEVVCIFLSFTAAVFSQQEAPVLNTTLYTGRDSSIDPFCLSLYLVFLNVNDCFKQMSVLLNEVS